MKKLIIYPLLLCIAFSAQAQEIVQLEKIRISVSPIELLPTSNPDEYKFLVNESYTGEFSEDPIRFIEDNFNIHNFIELVKDKKYDSYQVTFSNAKGFLKANYAKDGKLIETDLKFKNIFVPTDIQNELYKNHQGWTMVKNGYRASGKNNLLKKEMYKIHLKKDDMKRVIKIDPSWIANSLSSR